METGNSGIVKLKAGFLLVSSGMTWKYRLCVCEFKADSACIQRGWLISGMISKGKEVSKNTIKGFRLSLSCFKNLSTTQMKH